MNARYQAFIQLCEQAAQDGQLEVLLALFLTPEEKSNLGDRVKLIAELLKGKKTQREIAKEDQISIAKITRGSNELKRTDETLISYLRSQLL